MTNLKPTTAQMVAHFTTAQLPKNKESKHMSLIRVGPKPTKMPKATKFYLDIENSKAMLDDTTDKEALLHFIYTRESNANNKELTDKYISEITNWSVKAVQKLRLKLEHKHWLKITQATDPDTADRFTQYFLRKDEIETIFYSHKTAKEIEDIINNASPFYLKKLEEKVMKEANL